MNDLLNIGRIGNIAIQNANVISMPMHNQHLDNVIPELDNQPEPQNVEQDPILL